MECATGEALQAVARAHQNAISEDKLPCAGINRLLFDTGRKMVL